MGQHGTKAGPNKEKKILPLLTGHVCQSCAVDPQSHAKTFQAWWQLGSSSFLFLGDSVHANTHLAVVIGLVMEHGDGLHSLHWVLKLCQHKTSIHKPIIACMYIVIYLQTISSLLCAILLVWEEKICMKKKKILSTMEVGILTQFVRRIQIFSYTTVCSPNLWDGIQEKSNAGIQFNKIGV